MVTKQGSLMRASGRALRRRRAPEAECGGRDGGHGRDVAGASLEEEPEEDGCVGSRAEREEAVDLADVASGERGSDHVRQPVLRE